MEEQEISDTEVEDLLGQLAQCHEACIQAMIYSLKEGGRLAEYENIQKLIDCSEICETAESFFLRESNYGGDILDICSSICQDCAESCEKFKGDRVMQSCALICRNCAEACEKILDTEEVGETETSEEL
jgi:hypothetical protein